MNLTWETSQMKELDLPEFHGPSLQRVREHRDLTQPGLAELLEKDESTIRRWELGWSRPAPAAIRNLAKALDVAPINFYAEESIDRFMSGSRLVSGPDATGGNITRDSVPELDASFIGCLRHLPQRHIGARARFRFSNTVSPGNWKWSGLDVSTAKWLDLVPGATVHALRVLYTTTTRNRLGSYYIYVIDDNAEAVLDLADNVEVEAIGQWVHAIGPDWRRPTSDPDENQEYVEHMGFVIAEILSP